MSSLKIAWAKVIKKYPKSDEISGQKFWSFHFLCWGRSLNPLEDIFVNISAHAMCRRPTISVNGRFLTPNHMTSNFFYKMRKFCIFGKNLKFSYLFYVLRKRTLKIPSTTPELHRYKIINNIPSRELLFSWQANILCLFLVYSLWLYFLALGSFSEIFKNQFSKNKSEKKIIFNLFFLTREMSRFLIGSN